MFKGKQEIVQAAENVYPTISHYYNQDLFTAQQQAEINTAIEGAIKYSLVLFAINLSEALYSQEDFEKDMGI